MTTQEIKNSIIDPDKYNGRTIEEIESNFPENMPDIHRKQYLKNASEVIERQKSGYNLNEIEPIKAFNHHLATFYLNKN